MHKSLSWDDARILLEVVRHGTQGAASKALGVDQATVSRRLLRLEDVVGSPLFIRDGTRLIPTDLARRMAEQAESAESALTSVFDIEAEAQPQGSVRVTAAPMIAAHVLAPALRLLRDLAPGVVVELIGAPENHGLTHRDADIAVRLTKPGAGSFLARRIAMVECGVFARRGVDAAKLPWIGFDDTLSDLPEARWLAKRESEPIAARAADLETMYQAARAGIGRALLPVAIARRDNSLALVPVADLPPARELWLLVERQVRQTRRVSVTLGWVEAVARDAFG